MKISKYSFFIFLTIFHFFIINGQDDLKISFLWSIDNNKLSPSRFDPQYGYSFAALLDTDSNKSLSLAFELGYINRLLYKSCVTFDIDPQIPYVDRPIFAHPINPDECEYGFNRVDKNLILRSGLIFDVINNSNLEVSIFIANELNIVERKYLIFRPLNGNPKKDNIIRSSIFSEANRLYINPFCVLLINKYLSGIFGVFISTTFGSQKIFSFGINAGVRI